jgi:hypothetical protein
MFLHNIVVVNLLFLLHTTAAIVGGYVGDDPFGFGDVKETCKFPPFIAADYDSTKVSK